MELKEAKAKTQAGGAFSFTFDHPPYTEHQIVAEPSNTPSAGTLTFQALAPGATDYFNISGNIVLTGGTATLALAKHIQDCPADAIKVTPASVPATVTFNVYLTSWNEGKR